MKNWITLGLGIMLAQGAWAGETVRLVGSIHGSYCITEPDQEKSSCIVADNFPEPFDVELTGDPGYLKGERSFPITLGGIRCVATVQISREDKRYELHLTLTDSANEFPTSELYLDVPDISKLSYLTLHGRARKGKVSAHYVFGVFGAGPET
jgi:hypothetical protein